MARARQQTIHLTAEETAQRLQQRLTEIVDLQQEAHLKHMVALLNTCEKHDVDGAIWDAVDRVGDAVNRLGGLLADAQKLADALVWWVDEVENGEGNG